MPYEDLRYPIGKFERPARYTPDLIAGWIDIIAEFPARLKVMLEGLKDDQLDSPYRPDGWTIRQVVHHCADSHMNSLVRFKLALTESGPLIKPYAEARWAELPDKELPVDISLNLLSALHQRWVYLLNSLTKDQLKRTFTNPETAKTFSLEETIGIYAWHCAHHLAHIQNKKARERW